jgi:hypothetical protein
MNVAALFTRSDSHYKSMGLECYEFERNALTWPGGTPGVFHPPCRAWGKYKTWANPRAGEKDLARWSMSKVRQFGGVVEHPASSDLWKEFHTLGYGMRDEFGGVLFPLMQSWYGHRAPKETALYLVGAPVPDLSGVFTSQLASGRIENMGKAERERTPPAFALFLANLAQSCEAAPAPVLQRGPTCGEGQNVAVHQFGDFQ